MLKSIVVSVPVISFFLTTSLAYAEGKQEKDPNKIICRSGQVDTGSIMSKKVCRTRSEWEKIAKQGEESARHLRDATQSVGKSQSGGWN